MAFIDEWQHWHAARTDALGAPYGPLSAICGIRVRGSAGVAAQHEEITLLHDHPVQDLATPNPWAAGLIRVPIGVPDDTIEIGSLTVQQRNLIEAEGVFALDAIEDRVHRISFGGLEVFKPHHDWVLVADLIETQPTDVTRIAAPCTDGNDRWIFLDATVRFTVEGREYELLVSREPQGAFHAVFSDPTRAYGFPFRNLHIPAPDSDGKTLLDFNRSVLPLAALSTRFPAVSAPPSNHLDVPITAGEHRPYLDDFTSNSPSLVAHA